MINLERFSNKVNNKRRKKEREREKKKGAKFVGNEPKQQISFIECFHEVVVR